MKEVQPGDIMLGNWFLINGYPMYVDAIFRDTVYLEFEGNVGDVWEENIKDLVPVTLTDDILRKCPTLKEGRNSHGGATFHVMEENGFVCKRTIEHWTNTPDDNEYKDLFHWCGVGEVESLHEVQNWYYMFEKKELEVKL